MKRKRLAVAEAGRPTHADDTACVMDSQAASGSTYGNGTAAPAPSAAADTSRPAKRQAAGNSDRPISSPAPTPVQAAPQGDANNTPGPRGASGHAQPVGQCTVHFRLLRIQEPWTYTWLEYCLLLIDVTALYHRVDDLYPHRRGVNKKSLTTC